MKIENYEREKENGISNTNHVRPKCSMHKRELKKNRRKKKNKMCQ
jgi:hypothetical protein